MPLLESNILNTKSGFQFSGQKIDDSFGSDGYTLACIAVDTSGSTDGFSDDIENTVKQIIEACKKDKRRESLLVRVTKFGSNLEEVIGYTLVDNIDVSVFDGKFEPDGMTALLDACAESIESATEYGKKLMQQYFTANAVVFIVTDGLENMSRKCTTTDQLARSIKDARHKESLESIKTILVGIDDGQYAQVANSLKSLKDEVGIDDFINMEDSDPKTFAKLGNFVSQSISSTQQARGTGGPSQSMTF